MAECFVNRILEFYPLIFLLFLTPRHVVLYIGLDIMGKCDCQGDSAVASLLYREPIRLFVHGFSIRFRGTKWFQTNTLQD